MSKNYEALFTPLKVGGVTLKNRIVLCAMGGTNPIGFEGKFSEGHRDYYIARAKANVGLMIPGVANVGSAGKGHRWLYEERDLFLGPMKQLMDDIHAYGSKFFFQLGTSFSWTDYGYMSCLSIAFQTIVYAFNQWVLWPHYHHIDGIFQYKLTDGGKVGSLHSYILAHQCGASITWGDKQFLN